MIQNVSYDKKSIINFFLEKGFLLSPEIVDKIEDEGFDEISELLNFKGDKPLVIDKQHVKTSPIENKKEECSLKNGMIILQNYKENNKKREVQDFVSYLRFRYDALKNILVNRPELRDVVSINRILNRHDKSPVAVIGLVKDKRITKNGNLLLGLEDMSGEINAIISKNNKDLFELANDIVLDEVIGLTGFNGDKIIFANNLLLPDVPLSNELKKLDEEAYIVFTSDVHLGSKEFFKDNFEKFIQWINGEHGTDEQKEIAKKVKYLFFIGDLVEGVGIYPGQEEDLVIKDIYEQYNFFADMIGKIRKDLPIISIGGNHDALRLSEPQPILDKAIAPKLFELTNFTFLTNPSVVNIFSSEDFPGFDILMYHGGSFTYYAENVDSIRKAGRVDRADLIMKFLMQRRHLAPSHGSTLYIPDPEKDKLIIEKVPDFFVTGHIHKTQVMNYRGVTMIGCGCWTGQTENQAKRGIVPDPNRVTLVNLQTREVRILNFEE